MAKVSVIIPSRNEIFLPQTIADVIGKAAGEVEVIVILDGYWPDPPLPDYPDLVTVHRPEAKGMRASINAAARLARGKYLLKTDAHCMFQEGFDEILAANCDDDWVVIPRRFSLDPINWAIDQNGKPPRDYHYLCYPHWAKDHDSGMHGVEWWHRGRERSGPEYDLDDNMSCQGSCWFMPRAYFWDFLGGLHEEGYGTFAQEFQEIGLKVWLGGGQVKINKSCWYAHLHKGKTYGRMWHMDQATRESVVNSHNWSSRYWMTNQWEQRVHNLEWLIEKFWPVPTWDEFGSVESAFKAWHEHSH
jgi:glycosyltransferase involved in cell wall biosynthesis